MSPRKPKNPSRVFLAKLLGRPWREIERDWRRRERLQKALETTGVEAAASSTAAPPADKEDRLNREAAPLRNLPLGTIIEQCEAMGLEVQIVVKRRDGSQDLLAVAPTQLPKDGA